MKTFGQKKMVRKMKYISDQEGIMNRYLREKENWNDHLEKSKHFISETFKEKKIKSIAVLGSGWLLDVPLKFLSEHVKKVLLVDVFHPPQVVKKVSKFKNVELFETDLTGGGIHYCWKLRKKKEEHYKNGALKSFKPGRPELPFEPDAFVSLNILNQLDILLVDFLKKKNTRFTEMELMEFRKEIQQFHLNWITKKPGCLISDVLEINEKENGETEEQQLVHVDLPTGKDQEEWIWNFDLSKTYREGKITRMKVRAVAW